MRALQIRRNDQGLALPVVIIITVVLTLLVGATTTAAVNSLDLSRHDQDWNAALAAAEAGIDDYLHRLNVNREYWQYSDTNLPPDGNTAFTEWVDVPGPASAGEYRYVLDSSSITVDGTVRLTSIGRVRDTVRTVESTLRRRGFLDFLYFTDFETKDPATYSTTLGDPFSATTAQSLCARYYYAEPPRDPNCTNIYFVSQDIINGPLHSNDAIRISGNPQFLGATSTSWDDTTGQGWLGSGNPVFLINGDPHLASPLTMPPTNTSIRVETDPNLGGTGCLYTGPTRIIFNSTGTMNVTSPLTRESNCAVGNNVPLPDNGVIYVQTVPSTSTDPNYTATCPVSSGNPIGYPVTGDITPGYGCFDGDAFVSGTLSGQVTIAAQDSVIVTANTTYQGGMGGTDLLGLIASNFVEVYHPVNSSGTNITATGTSPITIHAAILSLTHSFMVQNYRRGAARGTLSVRGAIAQKYRGIVGTFSGGTINTGYSKDYVYDQRLKYLSPPHFLDPVASAWKIATWAEIPTPVPYR